MTFYKVNGLITIFLMNILCSSNIDGLHECQNQNKRIIGYYTGYNNLRPFSHEQARILTHLIFYCEKCTGMTLQCQDYLKFYGKREEIEKVVNIAKSNNVSVMMSLGNGLGDYLITAIKVEFENVLIRIISFFQEHIWLDGIELEVYLHSHTMDRDEVELEFILLKFIHALRNEFNKFNKNLLISVHSFRNVKSYYTDWLVEAIKYLDFISVYTLDYDYPSPKDYDPYTYPNSPLFSPPYGRASINKTMQEFSCNINSQLEIFNIMVPFYGIVWKDVDNYPIIWNSESHSIRYRLQYPAIKTDNLPWRLINIYSNLNLETYHEETQTPFIMDKEKHEFISYENERSIGKKTKLLVKTSVYFNEIFFLMIGILCVAIIIFILFLIRLFLIHKYRENAYNSIIIQNPLGQNEKINYISIGKGKFSEAFLCEWSKNEKITIKVMHRQDEWSKSKMAKEMAILVELDHQNICSFHGLIKLDGNRLGQIFDFAPLGDLLNFLCGLSFTSNQIKIPSISKPNELIRIALMIADGLKYLKMKNIVHGNLHLKNCLIFEYSSFLEDENYIVKLTDYSQMNFIGKADFYNQIINNKYMSKFIAPELLSRKTFSFASDIWSFGSIVHSIFSQDELNKLISPTNLLDENETKDVACIETAKNNIFPRTFPFSVETLVIRCWMHYPQHRIDIVDAYNYLLQFNMNDTRNTMEMNDDDVDLYNINPQNFDNIDPELFDSISQNDSIRMDFTHQHSTNTDEFQQNDLNDCVTPPTILMPQISQINTNYNSMGCSSNMIEMEQNQPLLNEMNEYLPHYLDLEPQPQQQLMPPNPVQNQPKLFWIQSFQNNIIQLRDEIDLFYDIQVPKIADSNTNINDNATFSFFQSVLSEIMAILDSIFVQLEPIKIELINQLQHWIIEQKNFSFGSHDRRGVLHKEELREIINENFRQFTELLEKCIQKIEDLTNENHYLFNNLEMFKNKFVNFIEMFLSNSLVISQQPPSYVERLSEKHKGSVYIFPIEIVALGLDVFENNGNKFEIIYSIMQVNLLNNESTCQVSQHFIMEQLSVEHKPMKNFISERFNVKIKPFGKKVGSGKMNRHMPEQPHFIQFCVKIKCLKYGLKMEGQLNSLKFCVVTNRNLEIEAKSFLLRAFPTPDGNKYLEFVNQDEMEDALDYKFNSILSSPVSHSKQRGCNSERQLNRAMKAHLSQMLEAENGLIKTKIFIEKKIIDHKTGFSQPFYAWFFGLAAELIQEDNLLLKMWNKGLIYGFCSNLEATELIKGSPISVVLIRFSNTESKTLKISLKDVTYQTREVKHYSYSFKNSLSLIKELIFFERTLGIPYIYPQYNIRNEIVQLREPECTKLLENYKGNTESSAMAQEYLRNQRPSASFYFRIRGFFANIQHQIGNTFH